MPLRISRAPEPLGGVRISRVAIQLILSLRGHQAAREIFRPARMSTTSVGAGDDRGRHVDVVFDDPVEVSTM